jgi:deazaflavin-dependent oxidoreductase (nitroreductase family)
MRREIQRTLLASEEWESAQAEQWGEVMMRDLAPLAEDDFCYLTTAGRRSGRPHTIEIWFALEGHTMYLLSGGRDRADWVKNVLKQPEVQVRIRERAFTGQARLITEEHEDALARKLVYSKYAPRDSDDLTDWSRSSLPVAIELIV